MNNILNAISSSSKGNCYIYNDDLMVDIGISYKKVKDYLKDIKLILLSHAHTDHFNKTTIKKIAFEYPNMKFVCGEFLVANLVLCGVSKKNIYVLKENKKYDLGKYIIEPVIAIHDLPNFGYKIIIKKSNYKIFHISDTGSISHIEAKNFDWISIEANYETDEELDKQIEISKENGEFTHLIRVKNTHLSQVQCMDWLYKNMGENTQYCWIHQHLEKGGKND